MLSSQFSLFFLAFDLLRFPANFATMPMLTQALQVFKTTFDVYAGKDGNNDTLTTAELTELLKKEFSLDRGSQYAATEYLSGYMDGNEDGVVTFKEFIRNVEEFCSVAECFGSCDGQIPKLSQALQDLKATFDTYLGKYEHEETLTKGELADLLKNEFDLHDDKDAVRSFFSQMDEDRDGTVTFQEFLSSGAELCMMIDGISSDEANLTQALKGFKKTFDKYAGQDENMTLSKGELSDLFMKEFDLHEDIHSDVVRYFSRKMDEDRDGAVDFKEFLSSAAQLVRVVDRYASDDAPKSELMKDLKIFKEVYNSYAVTQGDEQTLTKHELVRLLKTELLPNEDVHEAEADYFLREMDKDGDGVVEFKEFVGFVAEISNILHLI